MSVIPPPPPPVPVPQSKGRKVARILTGSALIALTFIGLGGVAAILPETFVDWWIPGLIAAVVGLACALVTGRFWRWLTGMKARWVPWACSLVVGTSVCMCALLLINMAGARQGEVRHLGATITSLKRETHHHTRRVGRRTYTPGREYYVYKAVLRLEDGRAATLSVPLDVYNHARKGDKVEVKVATGSLGWDVLDTRDIKYPKHKKKKRHHPPSRRGYNPDRQ